jgi:hypothetical protein
MSSMSVRVGVQGVALAAALAWAGACGGGDDDDDQATDASSPPMADAARPDAAPPDADPCALCTPTQDCAAACACPADPSFDPFTPILTMMDTAMLAPTVLGIAAFSPDGADIHALVVGFHPTDTPVGVDIDLSTVPLSDAPFVGLGYDVDVASMTTRGTLRSTAGTLHLTRRCNAGVGGTMAGVVLVEVDAEADPPVVLPGGCSFTIPSVAFSFGAACP